MRSAPKILWGLVVAFLVLAAVCLALAVAARQYLPAYLTGMMTEKLQQQTGLPVQLKVRSAWLEGAELTDLRLGTAQAPVLKIAALRVDYSLMDLYRRGRIAQVNICGLDVFAELHGGRLRLKNRKLRDLLSGGHGRAKSNETENARRPLLSIGRLRVAGDLWVDGLATKSERIPFQLDLSGGDRGLEKALLEAHLYPRGQKVSLIGRMSGRRVNLKIDIANLSLGAFNDIIPILGQVEANGRLWLQAGVDLDLKTGDFSALEVRCRIAEMTARVGNVQLGSPSAQDLWLLNVTAKGSDRWQITLSGLSLIAPLPVHLESLSLQLAFSGGTLKGEGVMRTVFFPVPGAGDIRAEAVRGQSIPLTFDISGEVAGADDWRVAVATRKDQRQQKEPLHLNYREAAFAAGPPFIRWRASGGSSGGQSALEVAMSGLRMRSGERVASVASLDLESRVRFALPPHPQVRGSAEVVMANADLTSGSAAMSAAKIRAQADFSLNPDEILRSAGHLLISGGRVDLPGSRLRVSRIAAEIPLAWPGSEKAQAGRFSTGPVTLQGRKLGSVKGRLRQTASGLAFTATFKTSLVSQLTTALRGRFDRLPAGGTSLHLNLDLKRPAAAPEIDVGALIAGAPEMLVGGRMGVRAVINTGVGGTGGRLAVSWKDGWLRMPEKKVRVDGVQADFSLPKLPELRSAPAQPIVFKRAAMGELVLENGRIALQLESPHSLLIEKSRFDWCQGIIEVPAFRIAPQTDDYRLTLYCDRLNLAQVLDQLGIDAQGKGTLNGRIPVHWSKGRVDFEDGFLFSTPGQGGKIRILRSDILTAGVTPGSPEYDQMALASEALKDYDYTWAKLNLNTEGDDLLMRLQLDGRPAGVLPFVYRKERGGFVRVREGAKGSRFQGIRLDVNFRLPLNRLLRYSDILPMVQ